MSNMDELFIDKAQNTSYDRLMYIRTIKSSVFTQA